MCYSLVSYPNVTNGRQFVDLETKSSRFLGDRQEKKMTFGNKIKYVCRREGINLREFSDLTGIPYGSLKNYSNPEKQPSVKRIKQISDIPRFNKYKSYLLDFNDDQDKDENANEGDSEITSLLLQIEEAGLIDEAIEILEVLAKRSKK